LTRWSRDRKHELIVTVELGDCAGVPGVYRYSIKNDPDLDAATVTAHVTQFATPLARDGRRRTSGNALTGFLGLTGDNYKHVSFWQAIEGEIVVTILTERQYAGNYRGTVELRNLVFAEHDTGAQCKIDSLTLGPEQFGVTGR